MGKQGDQAPHEESPSLSQFPNAQAFVQIPNYSDESHTLFGQPFSRRGKPKLRFSTEL
jgi:hypothetical protein